MHSLFLSFFLSCPSFFCFSFFFTSIGRLTASFLTSIHTTFNFFSTPGYLTHPAPSPFHLFLFHTLFVPSLQPPTEQSSGAWKTTTQVSLSLLSWDSEVFDNVGVFCFD
ncbi:uncharacterized protein J3D65DRAFT_640614, partial [Phyllosticta citribraziliensis]